LRHFRRFILCAICRDPVIFQTIGIIRDYQMEGINKCNCGEVSCSIDMIVLFENYRETFDKFEYKTSFLVDFDIFKRS